MVLESIERGGEHPLGLIKWLSENPDQLDDAPLEVGIVGLKE